MKYLYRETAVKTLIYESDRQTQIDVCRLSAQLGFTGMKEAHSADGVRSMLMQQDVDLLFCRISPKQMEIVDVIRELRSGELGRNQFAVVVALLADPDTDVVRRAIDAGFDDIVTAPINEKMFKARIGRFLDGRTPFVVTLDYLGPDRRQAERPGTIEIPKIRVPNPVRAMAGGKLPREKLHEAVDKYAGIMKEQRSARKAMQIEWLSKKLVQKHVERRFDEEYHRYSKRLLEVSLELENALDVEKRPEFSPTLERLRTTTKQMSVARDQASSSDLDVLPRLADSLHRAFDVAQATSVSAATSAPTAA